MKYVPLDELLARPRIRALRALARHADWVSSFDLYETCDVSDLAGDRKSFAGALHLLDRAGDIERRLVPTGLRDGDRARTVGQYRITSKGRAGLRAQLEAVNPDPSEFLS